MTELVCIIGAAGAPGGLGGILSSPLVPLVVVMVLFYFMIFAPQRKREKEHRGFLDRLKKGDQVVTNSGIFGEVASVTPDQVVLEIAPKVKVTFQRGSIAGASGQTKTISAGETSAVIDGESKSSGKSLKKKKK